VEINVRRSQQSTARQKAYEGEQEQTLTRVNCSLKYKPLSHIFETDAVPIFWKPSALMV
jgi:hypothetical protein